MRKLFTSESVTEGHPDKLCDYISDSVLDACLAKDPNSRVACETVAGKGEIVITGEITSNADINIEEIARNAIKEIGYDNAETDIDYRTCKIHINMSKQSPDIAMGVDASLEEKQGSNVVSEGAGDQGIMFGFACNETDAYMPLPIYLAHKLAKRLTQVRKEGIISYLRPDGKTQVTVEYQNNKPKRIDTIIIAAQHKKEITQKELKKYIIENVITKTIPQNLLDKKTKILINTSGSFIIGGPYSDSGTTGRKIIVDTYGGTSRIGGGCLSSKDPTKVDRSAAYYTRYVAKNIVAHNLADKCEIQVSYAIGKQKPISLFIETFNTEKVNISEIYKYVETNFNFSVENIINELNLKNTKYYNIASYGHFGRTDINLPWENIKNTLQQKEKKYQNN